MTIRVHRGSILAVLLGAASFAIVPSRADIVSEEATGEANRTVSGSPPTATLTPGPHQMLTVSMNSGSQTSVDSDVEFSLTALGQGSIVQSAVLSLNVAGAQAGAAPGSVSINGYADGDGIVGLGDFAKATTLLGSTGSLMNGAPGSVDIPMAFDVTSFIQSLVNQGTRFVGFHLEGPGVDSSATIWGSAAADLAARPHLAITFAPVPEPASVVLFASGLAGMLGLMWRRGR